MVSALEWLTEVLFDDDQRAAWSAASGDERSHMLQEAGLNELSAEEMSEAMQLLAEELPPEQAAAIVGVQSFSGVDGLSAIDHFVDNVEAPAADGASDEFDLDPAGFDEFNVLAPIAESEEPEIDFDSEITSDKLQEFVVEDEDPISLDDFDGSPEPIISPDLHEEGEFDQVEELDLGDDPGDF